MKILKKSLLGLGMLALFTAQSSFVNSQSITTSLATGTSTTTQLPMYGLYGYTYSQQIYLSTDFNTALAGQPNLITKIRFFNVTGSLTNANSWTIYMANTTQTNFGTTTSWVTDPSLTQVFSGNLTAPAANTWMEITLDTPFLWDGVSNVVVGVDENTGGYSSITWRSHSTGANRSMYYYSDGTNPNPSSPPTASARFGYVPQTQFVHEPTTACSGTPAHTTALVNDASICTNETVNFSLSGLQFVSGFTYQWQYNSAGTWTDFTGATASTFSTSLSTTSNVRCIVTCTASTAQDISEEVSVVVNPIPTVTVDITETAFCSDSPAEIEASGADTYAWTPATGLSATNTALVMANPTAETTYTVTGTTAAGCSSTATSTIYPLSKIKRSITSLPAENCAPGSPVALTVSTVPATIAGGASWEYKFIGGDSVTAVQDWNVSNTFNFIPTADSVYSFFYQVRSNNCSDYIDSNIVKVIIGFGGKTDVTHYNCNSLGGVIEMYDVFGQTELDSVFFDTLNNAHPTLVMTGSAAFVDGRAEITPSAASKTGSLTINPTNFASGVNNALKFSFEVTADMPINNFGTGGGDGIAFSFGNDALITGAGPYQNGKGSKLRLVFDAANNANGNVAGIYLTYGFNATDMAPNSTGVLAYSNNVSIWKTQTDVPVEMTIDVNSKVTVKVGGQVIFNEISLPASYKSENVTTWKHLFTALTGGDALRHAVKNYRVDNFGVKFGITTGTSTSAPTTWQTGSVFSGLLPGTYNIWLAKNETGNCNKKVATVEIVNTNPVVNLGNDTTICAGETLTLDAGNVSSTYVWSNSNAVTQTIEVTNPGNYVVQVLDTNGCTGIGSIIVSVNELPEAASIYAQGNFPTVSFGVVNPTNVDNYAWNFGDGTTIANGPASLSHTYEEDGTYNVTVTISNDCGTETLTQSITIQNTASLDENQISGLLVYPNPVADLLTIEMTSSEVANATIYSVTGSKVHEIESILGTTKVDVKNWNKGIYFVHITSNGKTSITKLIVQ